MGGEAVCGHMRLPGFVILVLEGCVSGQWPAFEVLQGQKGRQMAAFPLEDERFQGLVRARAVWALWPDGSPSSTSSWPSGLDQIGAA